MQIVTSKIQERGFATIPQEIRERLNLIKGSTLSFIIFDDGRIELRPVTAEALVEPDQFQSMLSELGMTYEDWRANRTDFAKKYREMKLQKEQA